MDVYSGGLMSIFNDVTFGFKGTEYTVPANRVMMLIAKVEDVISLQELTSGRAPKLSRLAEAYSVALNYAGAEISIEEVYESLFSVDEAGMIQQSVTALIALMLPPSTYHPSESTEGKPQ